MTLFTLSPDLVRGLACAVWLAVLVALFHRRPVWRYTPGGVRLMLAGLAIVGTGLLIGAAFTVLHRVAVLPDRIAAEAVGFVAGLFALAGVLRYEPPAPVATASPSEAAVPPCVPEAADDLAWRVNALERFQTEKQEAMARLAGGLAHDFSNVLTVILTASEILLMDRELPENLRRRIERIHGAAQRGAGLADQLRAFAGRQDLRAEEADLHALLRASAVEFKATVGPEIELCYELAEGPCPVLIDPGQMRAALVTVLAYYRSTLPEGGRVELFTRFERGSAAEDGIPDGAAADGATEAVALSVAGSGRRLAMEQADRLLAEPYSIGASSVVGGGFGLSLVAGFIRQSGGQVRFVEEQGAGPVLEIRLPLALDGIIVAAPPVEEAPVVPAAPEAPASSGARHVLVVDDDDLMRESAAAELASLGCRATLAASAAEALDRLEADPSIDAVLSDVTLTGAEDGVWLARQARARFPGLHLVLMSGDIARAGALEAGEAVLLPKPFTRARLAASLDLRT